MPAGDLEKAQIAYQFGADACYGSTSAFSMRTREIGFTYETLKAAIDFAHAAGKKFYVTLNTYPHELELPIIKAHAKKLISMHPDAIIVADPGILTMVKREIEKAINRHQGVIAKSKATKQTGNSTIQQLNNIEIHLSTQANSTNSETIKFWADQGVSRVILARELSLTEIAKIRKAVPKKITIEAFVHGAMCNSVSGRCNLSNYLSYRDANRGACVQACRWKFALVEEKRPGQYIPIEEDDMGSYIYNSRDLCMIDHLDEMANAGIGSFKVEGRNKSIYYAAIVARAYRKAIDSTCHPEFISGLQEISKQVRNDIQNIAKELQTVTSRGYSTGFYFGKPTDADINYETSRPSSGWQFVGIIKKKMQDSRYDPPAGAQTNSGSQSSNSKINLTKQQFCNYIVETRNEILPGSRVEIVTPNEIIRLKLNKFTAPNGEPIEKPNPNTLFVLKTKKDLPINSMIRAKLVV